jgi:hypothetical protein
MSEDENELLSLRETPFLSLRGGRFDRQSNLAFSLGHNEIAALPLVARNDRKSEVITEGSPLSCHCEKVVSTDEAISIPGIQQRDRHGLISFALAMTKSG